MADGTILTVQQTKNYLEIETQAFDALLDALIEEAEAIMQGYVQVPITKASYTELHDGGTSILFLRRYPVDGDTVVVTDTQGTVDGGSDDEVIVSTAYRVYPEKGEVMKTSTNGQRSVWAQGRRRFSVAYDAGLDQHPQWSTHVKAELRASLRDLVAHWYEHRRPGASEVREGGGLSVRLRGGLQDSVPDRVRETWDRYSAPVFG